MSCLQIQLANGEAQLQPRRTWGGCPGWECEESNTKKTNVGSFLQVHKGQQRGKWHHMMSTKTSLQFSLLGNVAKEVEQLSTLDYFRGCQLVRSLCETTWQCQRKLILFLQPVAQ